MARNAIQVSFVAASVVILCLRPPLVGNEGLEVRDSSGRIRLTAKETEAGGFALLMLDAGGNTRVSIDIDKNGEPAIHLRNKDGIGCITMGESSKDWGLTVNAPGCNGPTLFSGANDKASISIGRGGNMHSYMTWDSDRMESALAVKGPSDKNLAVLSARDGRTKLLLWDASGTTAGMALRQSIGNMWLGNDGSTLGGRRDAIQDYMGVHLDYDPAAGAGLLLRQSKQSPAVLLTDGKLATGLNIGVGDRASGLRAGIRPEDNSFSFRVFDDQHGEMLKLPPQK